MKLGRKVEDLEDVRYLVNVLNEVLPSRAGMLLLASMNAFRSVVQGQQSTMLTPLLRNTLPQIREKEADIDALITPIEEMYSLLLRYEVRAQPHNRP